MALSSLQTKLRTGSCCNPSSQEAEGKNASWAGLPRAPGVQKRGQNREWRKTEARTGREQLVSGGEADFWRLGCLRTACWFLGQQDGALKEVVFDPSEMLKKIKGLTVKPET